MPATTTMRTMATNGDAEVYNYVVRLIGTPGDLPAVGSRFMDYFSLVLVPF